MKIDYHQRLLEAYPEIEFLERYTNARTRIPVRYPCGHTHSIIPGDIMKAPRFSGSTCSICRAKERTKSAEVFERELLSINPGIEILGEYKGAKHKVSIKCKACLEEFSILPNSVLTRGICSCPNCGDKRNLNTGRVNNILQKLYGHYSLGSEYTSTTNAVKVTNSICGHTFDILPSVFLYQKWTGQCPICTRTTRVLDTGTFIKEVLSIAPDIEVLGEYVSSKTLIDIKYTKCGHTHSVRPNDLKTGHCILCPLCNKSSGTSKAEQDILAFVRQELGDTAWIINRDKLLLEGLELDILIPDLDIAIEYNGLYYHHNKDHLNKTIRCEELGIKLFHIFENDWIVRPAIIKSRIRAALGTINTRVYGRNLHVKEIPWGMAAEFLNSAHIQGSGAPTKFNYGLFKGEHLVQVMTFNPIRFGGYSGYKYELVRLCNALNTIVVGGASKLLKYFRTEHTGGIISYADRSWGFSTVYTKLGFVALGTTVPGFSYYKNNQRYSRQSLQKHKVLEMYPSEDAAQTADEILRKYNYNKIYNCGNFVYGLK